MIGFSAPWALLGLAAAAVPLLLHLFARREPPTVLFPAVRYLTDTARLHRRRLTLQHWLLLLARTLLLVLLVLAAAGPTVPARSQRGHVPSALVVVVDNSLSSAASQGGVAGLDRLRAAAAGILDRAGPGDQVWLLAADLVPRRGSPDRLRRLVDSLVAAPVRLDLGTAIGLARDLLAGDPRPGEVVVLSDLQATAVTAAPGRGPLTVARPREPPVANAGLARVEVGPQPWTAGRGLVTIAVAGDPRAPVPVRVTLPGRSTRQGLAAPGAPLTLALPVAQPGWLALEVSLAPDELRLDDRWTVPVRVAPPAVVRWDPADRFLAAAAEVLVGGGRLRRAEPAGGPAVVTLGSLGPGPSVILPPGDPARLGALNRALAARGVPWRFGAPTTAPARSDSGLLIRPHEVRRRHPLEPAAGPEAGVLARVAGAPWIVRAGTVVLLGSRLDTAWTDLPLRPDFIPLVDALANRVVAGELALLSTTPDGPARLPDAVETVAWVDDRQAPRRVEGGAPFRPAGLGIHYLLAGGDTVGALAVQPDPRESSLDRAPDGVVRALWPGARVVDLQAAPGAVFLGAARASLQTAFLLLAALLALVEALLAGGRRWSR